MRMSNRRLPDYLKPLALKDGNRAKGSRCGTCWRFKFLGQVPPRVKLVAIWPRSTDIAFPWRLGLYSCVVHAVAAFVTLGNASMTCQCFDNAVRCHTSVN